jgi:hypothetical protein
VAPPGGSSESTLAVFIQVPFAQMGDLLLKTDPALRAVREKPACLVRNIDLAKKLSTHILRPNEARQGPLLSGHPGATK